MPITINGSGTVTGISAGGLPDACITTDDIAANAVTAAKLGADQASGLAKAFVNFNGTGTVAIQASFNVSSITDNGTGDYTVNFTTALADANYCTMVMSSSYSATANSASPNIKGTVSGGASTKTTSAIAIVSYAGNSLYDFAELNVAIFR